jgi:hypothetical protein
MLRIVRFEMVQMVMEMQVRWNWRGVVFLMLLLY